MAEIRHHFAHATVNTVIQVVVCDAPLHEMATACGPPVGLIPPDKVRKDTVLTALSTIRPRKANAQWSFGYRNFHNCCIWNLS